MGNTWNQVAPTVTEIARAFAFVQSEFGVSSPSDIITSGMWIEGFAFGATRSIDSFDVAQAEAMLPQVTAGTWISWRAAGVKLRAEYL